MLYSLIRWFYPDLRDNEIKKFSLLSCALLLIIGAYWMMRLLKDTLFLKIAFPTSMGWSETAAREFWPWAKTSSVVFVVIMVLIYSKLVDLFEKHKLFYIYSTLYGVIFSVATGLLIVRHIWGDAALGKWTLAALGWGFYLAIESFGSIVIALFWSFVASVTASDSAKRGYPLIIAGAQIGSITGSAITIPAKYIGSVWPYFLLGAVVIFSIMLIIQHFMNVIPAEDLVGNVKANATEKKKEGFIEGFLSGLVLLATRPYLLGVLIVSTFYEVVITIVDYQMKSQAAVAYAGELGFQTFMGYFGVIANGLALVMALLGTRYLLKKFGLRFCLLVFPAMLGSALAGLYVFYKFGGVTNPMVLLWATASVVLIGKALSYSLNNPSKEMMYIPTSKNAKFKAKGWIDSFGGRSAKAAGAQIARPFANNLPALMAYGTMIGLGLVGVWAIVAFLVGSKYKKLTDQNEIIE